MEEKELTAVEYFEDIKSKEGKITEEGLKKTFQGMIALAEKYKRTNQVASLRRLEFLSRVYIKEQKILSLGIDTYIYKSDIEDYIDNVSKNVVKVIELKNYIREIPDEIVGIIEKTKDIFDELYVVYTDYTGKEERRVEKTRQSADPILFGVFKEDELVADRFYVLGDWEDEFCDLTLDKMIEEKGTSDFVHKETYPETPEELADILKEYRVEGRRLRPIGSDEITKGFFNKVKSYLREKLS